jgi:signal transduction histidine kinase
MAPIPENEMERLIALSDLNIDFADFENNFNDLAKLAAKIAGTDISLVNLIDAYTQWTVSYCGLNIQQMPREDSVCQYTIMGNTHFEVKDLSADDRFKDKFYVSDDPHLKYYYGIPLDYDGQHIGALCLLDKAAKELTPEKEEMLTIIAQEVVNRLKLLHYIQAIKKEWEAVKLVQSKVAHDIRGPIGGIIGLTELMYNNYVTPGQFMEMVAMISKAGKSVLELADEILENSQYVKQHKQTEFNLLLFKEKLERLYLPQAKTKNIALSIQNSKDTQTINFPGNKLLQIAGNIISNAIKFTPRGGQVNVLLSLLLQQGEGWLHITVKDNGKGIDAETLASLMNENVASTSGTAGEKGYGFGLLLVKHLVKNLQGEFEVESNADGAGATFKVTLPVTPPEKPGSVPGVAVCDATSAS